MIFVRLRADENGQAASVYDVAELFQQFGDINVVKATETSCFIDLQDVDKSAVVANKKQSPAQKLMEIVKGKMKTKEFGIIEAVTSYREAPRYQFDSKKELYEGGI